LYNPGINIFFLKEFLSNRAEKINFRQITKLIVKNILKNEELNCSNINFIFCDDEKIREYNSKYLKHDYETDVLTFYDTDDDNIESDIIVSVDSVLSNAKRFKTDFKDELNRVIIHGVLHLCGYKDETRADKIKIRKRENYYLNNLKNAG
jgi:rRNA maturation RNase YbeY